MRYVLSDEHGDTIIVQASKRTPASAMVIVEFRETIDGEETRATMLMDDRTALDLKQAITRSLKESERHG